MHSAPKDDLQHYLQQGRGVVLWKLDGLGERDVRRPLTPTGTNLLGLVKHLAGVESDYFGEVWGRPFPEPLEWVGDAEPNADMWATANESREEMVELYIRVGAHIDATITDLPLNATAEVPCGRPESRTVTLHRLLATSLPRPTATPVTPTSCASSPTVKPAPTPPGEHGSRIPVTNKLSDHHHAPEDGP